MVTLNKVDLLGASSAALSMIFELIKNTYADDELALRIIKNTNHSLQHAYEIDGISHEVIQAENVQHLAEHVFLGVYKSETKRLVYQYFQEKYDLSSRTMINLIHRQSAVSSTASLGKGIQVNPMTTIAPYAKIGDFVSINRNVSIGHHSEVGNFCTINPSVHIAGNCQIAENVTFGIGAIVLDEKRIGKNSIVGAGALVTKDVPENVLVLGSPAKIVKEL